MRKATTTAALVVGLSCVSPHAGAETAEPIIRLDNPAAVAFAMRERGYRARLTETEHGRPMVESGVGGVHFEIVFYGCRDHTDCRSLLFVAAFDTKNGRPLDFANSWNRERLYGRAMIDAECDPVLDMIVPAQKEMLEGSFFATLDDWDLALSDFRDRIWPADYSQSKRPVLCGSEV